MTWVKSQKNIWKMCAFRTEHTFPSLFFSNTNNHYWQTSSQLLLSGVLRHSYLPLIHVPAVTPERTFMWHLERLNEEHVWTAMAANWFLYPWNITIICTWDADHICNTPYKTRLEKIHVTNGSFMIYFHVCLLVKYNSLETF